ncbi:hypothetical protein CY34DRAFT_76958 [Suillus luteus UH-Slu-Lm8-n1]|uniref:F-box domain-containing protein n=1 Tax=Suillus luteus UH-Slu-Lm8-n1 TaxID=930992 RepID=A0A0D0BJA8_9AGAM|nr:hypothetical protein CY34DRAFT_76958 [Suillus luteus UH-Slu-Lm8-n1]
MVSSCLALYISEILSEISYQLEDDRKSLSSLARCCKAFSDPALDVLWRRMSLFSPFIPLLPPKVLTLWVRIIPGQAWTRIILTHSIGGMPVQRREYRGLSMSPNARVESV